MARGIMCVAVVLFVYKNHLQLNTYRTAWHGRAHQMQRAIVYIVLLCTQIDAERRHWRQPMQPKQCHRTGIGTGTGTGTALHRVILF